MHKTTPGFRAIHAAMSRWHYTTRRKIAAAMSPNGAAAFRGGLAATMSFQGQFTER